MSSTIEFLGEAGSVTGIRVADTQIIDGKRVATAGTERTIDADLVLIALGFVGPETAIPAEELNLGLESNSTFARADDFSTDVPGLFMAGDAGRGQSLIVWAIAEGRAVAATIDSYLEGTTDLPSPVRASDQPISVYS
jgi:glutamate synthase (NADPH/NADH) small chain